MERYCLLLIACLISAYSYSQSDTISRYVVATAGGDTTVNDISVSWTLGEVAVEKLANEDSTLILTQGFQQVYFEIVSVGEPLSNNFEMKVYPNPATEYIWVLLESEEIKDAVIEIFDLEGKVVYNKHWDFVNGPNQIMLNDMVSSQYILRISDKSGQALQTFKLIKR